MFYSLFYRLGFGDWGIKLVEQFLSVMAVYFTYRLGKDLYSNKVGLVAAFMLSVLWVHMFWATRISGGLFTMALWTVAAWLFWEGYVKKGSPKYCFAGGVIIGFGTYAYASMGFILLALLAFVLITERLSFFRNKRFWYAAIGALLIVIPFALYSYHSFGHVYPRFERTQNADWKPLVGGSLSKWEGGNHVANLFAYTLSIPGFITWPFFLLLVAGGIYLIGNLILGFDLLLKRQRTKLKRDLYVFLWAFTVLVMFSIVYTTTGFEFDPRFLFPMYPAIFLIASVGLFKSYYMLKKYNKPIAFIVVSAILVFGMYSNLIMANNAIESKKDTYIGEKEVGVWLRGNTLPGDYILTCNQEVIFWYYTERNTNSFGKNVTLADEQIDSLHPKYVVLDVYNSDCAFDIQDKSSHKLVPAYATFLDAERTKPAVVVYSVI